MHPTTNPGDALHANRGEIIAAWEREIRSLPKAASLPEPLLVDHLPLLLDEIAAALKGGSDALPLGSQHAIQRLGTGFDLSEVIAEYGILRRVLFRRLAAEQIALRSEDAEFVHRLIDEAISRAVAAYGNAAQRAHDAIDAISAAALEETRPHDLLQRLLQSVVDAVPAVHAAAIVVHDDHGPRLGAAIGLPLPAEAFETGAAEGWRTGEPLRSAGFQMVLSVPLMQNDREVGAAHIASRTAPQFSDDQRLLFGSMAARAADLVTHSRVLARERAATLTARALSTASSLDEAIVNLLATIGSTLGWDLAIFWSRLPDQEALRRSHMWSAPGVDASRFDAASVDLVLPRRIGLPGRAWESGVLIWSGDLSAEPGLLRLEAAVRDGLQSAVVFPVRDQGVVIGVFEFFARGRRARTEEAVEMTAVIARQLPDFLGRLAVQERVRRSEAEKSAILQTALDAIISMDAGGLVTGWNPAAERIFGYPARDAIGRELAALIVPDHLREAHRRGLARYLATGEQRSFDRRLDLSGLRRDGTQFPVELVITHAGAGTFTGYVRDISDRAQADSERDRLYREARQATQMREQVLAIVSHDLRSPLGVIMTGAGLLRRAAARGAGEGAVRRTVERIERAVNRMDRLLGDLLDVASMEAGGLSIERADEALAPLLEEAVDLHRTEASERRIDIRTHVAEGVPACCVHIDRHRILQVLANLLGNALKFSPSGSSIDVRATNESGDIHVTVTDVGPGIPDDELPHLFDPYWSGRQGRKLGTGLGLFISKAIVEAHGGRLLVESHVGSGTTFTFTLPVVRSAPPSGSGQP